jgi:hypothetical protein
MHHGGGPVQARIDTLRERGVVRMVAVLRIPESMPEGADSQAAIHAAQEALLLALGPYQATVIRRFARTPVLVLDVDERGADVMLCSPSILLAVEHRLDPAGRYGRAGS